MVKIYASDDIGKHEITFFVSIISNYFSCTSAPIANDPDWDESWDANKQRQEFQEFTIWHEQNKENFKTMLNEYPESIAKLMGTVLDCQKKHFDYKQLPSHLAQIIIPGIQTNGKLAGTATIFDCVFCDVQF